MSKIFFIINPLDKKRFSGGSIAIFKYASGLISEGHEVNLVPIAPSTETGWFEKYGNFEFIQESLDLKWIIKTIIKIISLIPEVYLLRKYTRKHLLKKLLRNSYIELSTRFYNLIPLSSRRTVWTNFLKGVDFGKADIILCTTYETAHAMLLIGNDNFYWFMMHDERLFFQDFEDKKLLNFDSLSIYNQTKNIIVNSSWLLNRLKSEFPEKNYYLCNNALEEEFISYENIKRNRSKNSFDIISYAGRGATWKGFAEMYEGFKLACTKRPDLKLRWSIYGMSNLNDKIIDKSLPIKRLGFISNEELRNTYLNSDVLLSASYYESFPLFPLEAMGLGVAVIATMPGCEDYLIDGVNCIIVPPKNIESISEALIRLAENELFRKSVIKEGYKTVEKFNWNSSIKNLNKIIHEKKR